MKLIINIIINYLLGIQFCCDERDFIILLPNKINIIEIKNLIENTNTWMESKYRSDTENFK